MPATSRTVRLVAAVASFVISFALLDGIATMAKPAPDHHAVQLAEASLPTIR